MNDLDERQFVGQVGPVIEAAVSKYRSLIELSGGAIVVTDDAGQVTEANSRAVQLTGYSPEEILGMNIRSWVHPDETSRYEAHMSLARSTGAVYSDLRLVTRLGTRVETMCATVVLEQGVFCSVLHDVTERNRRERELQRRNREAVALYEVGRQITSSFDTQQVLSKIVKNTVWLLECHVAGVALLDSTSNKMSWVASLGTKSIELHSALFDFGTEFAGKVVAANVPILFKDFPNDPKVNPVEFPMITAEGLRSVIGVPMSRKGRVFGVLMSGYRELHTLTADDVRLVSNLADQAALALENAQLYQTTLDHSRNLEALSAKLASVQEEERLRIARELHDGVGQALMGIRLNLDLLCNEVPIAGGAGRERVKHLQGIIDETANDIRQIASDLRPAVLDDFGFVSALRLYAEGFSKRTNISVRLQTPESTDRWDPRVEATLYRVVQEALTNVAKHSGASNVDIKLASNLEKLSLDIIDNGTTVDTDNGGTGELWRQGLGILNMKERIAALKGTFTLSLNEREGVRVHIEIPIGNT